MSKLNTSQTLQTAKAVSTNAPSGILQRKCATCGTHTVAGDKCEDCQYKQGILQRKSLSSSENTEVPPIVHEVLNSPGQPLDKTTRAFFESRFAHNFSGVPVSSASKQMSHSSNLTVGKPTDVFEQEADRIADSILLKEKPENKTISTKVEKFDLSRVRVHTGARAAESADAVNALAYTVGNNIVFGAGQFAPETREGQRLLAHELVHTVQQATSASETSARIQRKPNKKPEPGFRFTVTPTGTMTAEEFRIFAASKIFGVDGDQAVQYADSLNWSGPHSTGGVAANEVNKPIVVQVSAGVYRDIKGGATGEERDAATGRAEGFDERSKEVGQFPKEEKKAIYDEVNRRFWDRTGYKTGKPLGDSEQDKAMAQLWLDIRDEVLVEHKKVGALPEGMKNILVGQVKLKPQDYTQLLRISEKLSESEWADYASRVTARTDDLNQLEKSVEAFGEKSRERQREVTQRKHLQHKFESTESLYNAYKDYLEKKSNATGTWMPGAGDNVVWIEPTDEEVNAAQQAEKDLTKRLIAADFPGGIPEYETSMRSLLSAFEVEAVQIGITALDRYESFLWKQAEIYQSDAVISALYDRLAPVRTEYAEFARNKQIMDESNATYQSQKEQSRLPGSGHIRPDEKLKTLAEESHDKASQHKNASIAAVGALVGDYSIFSETHLPLKRRINKEELAQADKEGLKRLLAKHIADRTEDVKNTRENLRDDRELIYKMDKLIFEVYRQMNIQSGSVFDTIIRDRANQISRDEALMKVLGAVLAIAFTIMTFGTGAVVVVGAAGALAVGGYNAYEEFEKFRIASDAAGSGLSSQEPSPKWLVIAIVGVVFDSLQALNAVRSLTTAARAFETSGDLVAFESAVQKLEKIGEIDAKMARAAKVAAEARLSAEVAGKAATRAMSGKLYSFPGPLADPDVYKAVVQWAYHRARQGLASLQEMILEMNKSRLAAGLAEMSEAELTLARRAIGEGFESAQVGTYTTKIKWRNTPVDARPHSAGGYWGTRFKQSKPQADAYELKVNPNNESYYLPHPDGGFAQFENIVGNTLQDGKRIIEARSHYHVADLPDFAKNKVLAEARRQLQAANQAGLNVEWLISEQKALDQIKALFTAEGVPVKLTLLPP